MPRVLYALRYVPSPRWKLGRPVREQPLEAHLAYMQDLYQRGDLLMGGPLLDNSGG